MKKTKGDDAWVLQVMAALKDLLTREATPTGDIEWLLLRCQDTLQYPADWDDWRHASTKQLVKDLEAFNQEFPGLLPQDLLPGAT